MLVCRNGREAEAGVDAKNLKETEVNGEKIAQILGIEQGLSSTQH